jgi:hypothetical protein
MKAILMWCVLFISIAPVWSQTENLIQIDSISIDSQKVHIHLYSNEGFIVGANAYVLHIGAKPFRINNHPNGSLQHLIFSINQSDFETLKKTDEIVLVYGYYYSNTQQDGESDQTNGYVGRHWKLGTIKTHL